jgi:hypothetical protein
MFSGASVKFQQATQRYIFQKIELLIMTAESTSDLNIIHRIHLFELL